MDNNNSRSLTDGEVALAKSVFGDSIVYSDVSVYSRKHNPFQPSDRAMAPDGNIWFSPSDPRYSDDFSKEDLDRKALFIHEMGHVWQNHGGDWVTWRGMFERDYDFLDEYEAGIPVEKWGIEEQASYFEILYLQREYAKQGLELKGYPSLLNLEQINPILPHCFPAGTLITLSDSSKKVIEEIAAGDEVLTFDAAGNRCTGEVVRTYTNTTDEFIRLSFDDNRDDLVATPGHAFLTETGDYLEIGTIARLGGGKAEIVMVDGALAKVSSRRIVYSAETAHLFEEAQTVGTIVGNLATKPAMEPGWQTYNFEGEHRFMKRSGGPFQGANARSQRKRGEGPVDLHTYVAERVREAA